MRKETALSRQERKTQKETISHIGHFEHLPEKVIADIELNEEMKNAVTDPRLLRFFNKDFLLRNAALFAVGTAKGSTKRLQTSTMHRGVLLRIDYGLFDEFGIAYGEIGVKGTGITRNSEGIIHDTLTSLRDPVGFFGYYHAKQEQDISNIFARNKGRNSRVIAILPIDHKEFRDWYLNLPSSKHSFYNALAALDVVEQNHDNAALIVRLMGTERYQDFLNSRGSKTGLYTPSRMIIRAARLIALEVAKRGKSKFAEFYELQRADDKQKICLSSIVGLSKGQLTPDNFKEYIKLLRHLLRKNVLVKNSVSLENFKNELTANASDWQNIDTAGFWYDWETSLPGPGYIEEDLVSPDLKFLQIQLNEIPTPFKQSAL